jgi:hypothetical protein
MFQTIEEIFRASHRLPPLRIRVVKRPVGKAAIFAGVGGVIALLALAAIF